LPKKKHSFYCKTFEVEGNYGKDAKNVTSTVETALDSVECAYTEEKSAFASLVKQFIKKLFQYSPPDYNAFLGTNKWVTEQREKLFSKLSDCFYPEDTRDQIMSIIDTFISRKTYFWDRLKHDCLKVVQNFEQSPFATVPQDAVYVIDNPNKSHCELNIREKLKNEHLYPSYVGISKLSCMVCDTQFVMDEEHYNVVLHNGGSGKIWPIEGLPNSIIRDPNIELLTKLIKVSAGIDTTRPMPDLDPIEQYPTRPFSPSEEIIGAENVTANIMTDLY